MRFLHKDFAPVRAWLAAGPADIRRLEWDLNPVDQGFAFLPWTVKRRPARPPVTATPTEVETVFLRSEIAGEARATLDGYFHVNAPPTDRAVSLPAAVEHVEAFGGPEEFLLVGHPDGGMVSVSRRMLPFQDGTAQADGWGPR